MNADRDLRNIWFYRDVQKREIDFVVQDRRELHPVEVKQSFAPVRKQRGISLHSMHSLISRSAQAALYAWRTGHIR